MLRWAFIVFLVVVVLTMVYVRFAPADPAQWHAGKAPDAVGDDAFQGGFAATRQITADPEVLLAILATIAFDTPRTKRFAGSAAERKVTFQSRSRLFGFPDYTTIEYDDAARLLKITGRQRFGIEDLGVNRARVENWLEQLGPLIVAP